MPTPANAFSMFDRKFWHQKDRDLFDKDLRNEAFQNELALQQLQDAGQTQRQQAAIEAASKADIDRLSAQYGIGKRVRKDAREEAKTEAMPGLTARRLESLQADPSQIQIPYSPEGDATRLAERDWSVAQADPALKSLQGETTGNLQQDILRSEAERNRAAATQSQAMGRWIDKDRPEAQKPIDPAAKALLDSLTGEKGSSGSNGFWGRVGKAAKTISSVFEDEKSAAPGSTPWTDTRVAPGAPDLTKPPIFDARTFDPIEVKNKITMPGFLESLGDPTGLRGSNILPGVRRRLLEGSNTP